MTRGLNLCESRDQAGAGVLVRAWSEPGSGQDQGLSLKLGSEGAGLSLGKGRYWVGPNSGPGHGLDRGINLGEGRNLSMGQDGDRTGGLSRVQGSDRIVA